MFQEIHVTEGLKNDPNHREGGGEFFFGITQY